jgi:uncharacterized protein YbjT (DUF2867 family)
MKKIVVIGGTGLIGSKVVALLDERGHQTIAAAPDTGVNTITGEGLYDALDGADVVIDVSNSPSLDGREAKRFFLTSGSNLLDTEKAVGVRHHVALSVVGTERLQDSGYFQAKLAQESLIAASPIPHTLVRATQFFEFLRRIADDATRGAEVRLPHALFQPMAAQDVAFALVQAALDEPVGGMIEVAGPQSYFMNELVAHVLEHDGDKRAVVSSADAPYFGVRLNEASLMPGGNARLGTTTFEKWLSSAPVTRSAPPLVTSSGARA